MADSSGMNLRQLAAEAGMSLQEARETIGRAGQEDAHPNQRLQGRRLRNLRRALGLPRNPGDAPAREKLSKAEIDAQILRPLLRKGKVSRTHTTAIENTYGHGIPDSQKAEAKDRVEALLHDGILMEKTSQGRRHLWLSPEGRRIASTL